MSLLLILPVGLALLLLAGAVFTGIYARRVEKRFPPVGRFIEVEGCKLHYVDEGPSAPRGTVVLLHGASSNLVESILGLGSALSGRYRVIAFDRPGHGWSSRTRGLDSAEPDQQAAVLAAALRRLDVRHAVIVGHSWSGTIVPHFGLDHHDVAGALLILGGITHSWPGRDPVWFRRLAGSWAGWVLVRTLAVPVTLLLLRRALRRTFAPQFVPADFLERAAIPLAFRPRITEVNAEDIAVMYRAVDGQSRRYGDIRLPAAVIAGERDEIVWTDLHARSFARDVPGAELVVLPGVGHMPQYARQDLVCATIEALAEKIAPAKASVR